MRRAVKLANGQQALPIRIEFLLTKRELVDALCWAVKDEDDPADWPDLTKRQVVERVRAALRESGDALSLWADEENVHRVKAIEAWARPLIERTFSSAFEAAGAEEKTR